MTRQPSRVKHAQNVLLDPEVERHHVELPLFLVWVERLWQQRIPGLVPAVGRIELIGGFGRHDARQIRPIHLSNVPCSFDQGFRIRFPCRDHAAHDAVGAQMPNKCPRIDFSQHWNRIALHVLVGHLL